MKSLLWTTVACIILASSNTALAQDISKKYPQDICKKMAKNGNILVRITRIPQLSKNYAYYAPLPDVYKNLADNDHKPEQSPILLCEDDKLIGAPHSMHSDIDKLGAGRYSHSNAGIIFSASDNTDPRLNQRVYTFIEIK